MHYEERWLFGFAQAKTRPGGILFATSLGDRARATAMPPHQQTVEQALAAQRRVLESMTPSEVLVEYARMFREAPPDNVATGELMERMLAELKRRLEASSS